MFYSVTDRKGESVSINLNQVNTMRLTKDDYGNDTYVVRMNNGDSIYLSADLGKKVKEKCSKQI